MSATQRILHVNASGRDDGSLTRQLSAELISALGGNAVVERDLSKRPIPFVDASWIGANFTPADQRSEEQKLALAGSDSLVEELEAADVLVLGTPMYNFSIPAALKSWIDQIARVGRTFRYTAEGPEGLLQGKKAYVVIATGGTLIGSEVDHASGYLKQILGFVGITDITFISAERGNQDQGRAQIAALRSEPA